MSTLFATTLFSIYTLYRTPEKAYPQTFEGKLEALDFELVLNSSRPFEYFYDFVCQHSSFSQPYFDVYILGKLYQGKLDDMLNNSATYCESPTLNNSGGS